LAATVVDPVHGEVFDVGVLYDRVARAHDIRVGMALEFAQAVCEVVASVLDDETLDRLRESLPDEWTTLFRLPVTATAPPTGRAPARSTNGDGIRPQPTSHQPLSRSHAGTVHSQSVAATADPHGDTKLSGARDDLDTLARTGQ
jgi:hypothetical protein